MCPPILRDLPVVRSAAVRVVAALSLVVGVAACSDDARPDPLTTATALSSAIDAGDLGELTFVDGDGAAVTATMTSVLGDLASADRTVSTVSVLVDPADDERATATLRWEWPIDPEHTWTYDTTVGLELTEGGWAVAWSPSVIEPSLQPEEHLTRSEVRDGMIRGQVLGADGVQIMGPRPVFRVGIDKTRVDASQLESSSGSLADLLGLEDGDAYRHRVVNAGPSAFVEALVVRADGSYPLDMSAIEAIPGAVAIDDNIDLAPTRDFARPVLGTVGPATAERIAESEGAVVEGDITGLSGLQLRYDDRLRGLPGVAIEAASETGRRELYRVDPTSGHDVTTTMHVGYQLIAEDILSTVESASAIAVVRPSDGHVLVAASGPGSGGLSTATNGRYPPGSTFKIVSALALLRAGLSPQTLVECPETTVVNGREFSNHSGYPPAKLGTIPLLEAIANSCNTAVLNQHRVVSEADVAAAAAALGVGQATEVGVPAFAGSVPADGGVVDHAAAMIGQGRVQMSPLAMATVAASVAAGQTVTPVFVLDEPIGGEPPPEVPEPLTAEEAAGLQAFMRAVVTDGTAPFLAGIPGPEIGAKTGTAEYGTPDEEGELPTHAWMIAFRDDLAVAVFVEEGESGSSTAGPILDRFLRSLPPA